MPVEKGPSGDFHEEGPGAAALPLLWGQLIKRFAFCL